MQKDRYFRTPIIILLMLLAAVTGTTAVVVQDLDAYAGRMLPGVTIAGIPVGGLTLEQAGRAADEIAVSRLASSVTLKIQDERLALTYAELGLIPHADEAVTDAYAIGRREPWLQAIFIRLQLARHPIDVPIRYTWNSEAVARLLAPMAVEIETLPRNAAVTVQDGQIVITQESHSGIAIDLAATGARIRSALGTGASDVEAVVHVTEPAFTTEEARELQVPLARFSTTIPGTENRVHNITLAAAFLSGTILQPGEVFSYNKAVGPRTVERGFLEAPVLIDDELVPGDGGGICQVSSTLFNVALLADLEIQARANHSRPVAYLSIGRDATVSYDGFDLRFKNTSERHILLWAWVNGRRLTITAFGTPVPGKEVNIEVTESEVVTPPDGTVTKNDPELEEGTIVTRDPLPGYRVRTYRIVTLNGQVVRHELVGRSLYRPVARTIKIGTKKAKKVADGRS